MSDKQMRRIEAKLDAIIKHLKIKPEDYEVPTPAAQANVILSEADRQAIANAPKPTPPPVVDVVPRVTATNAPSVTSSVPPVTDTSSQETAEYLDAKAQLAAKKADSGAKGPAAKE